MNEQNNLTLIFYPSMLKTFSECPKKYEFKYQKNITMPQITFGTEKGKKIHALANFYLKGQDISKLEKALTPEEHNIFEHLKNNEYFQKEYLKSEYNLTAKVNDFWISGRIDAVMKDKDSLYILDYKTGGVPENPKYDFQTIFYLILINTATGKFPTFVYIDLKNNKNITITLDENLKSEYERIITKTCTEILSTKTYTQNKQNCEKCEYKKLCLINQL